MPHEPRNPGFVRLSFWKPEPVPPKNSTIVPIDLMPLGKLDQVAERLMEVPHMHRVIPGPWEPLISAEVNLHWQVEAGVLLQIKTEQGPPKPGEVLTIQARSGTPTKTFFRLYVQIFEQLGVTVLDEQTHEFMTPKEFKERLAG